MLAQLLHTVESGLKEAGRHLLRPGERERLEDEADSLAEQLRLRRDELARARAELGALKRRLPEQPVTAALLHTRIEEALYDGRNDEAWRLTLELDELRRGLAADQQACPRLELRCWCLHFLVRRLERRLAELRERLDLS